MREEVRSRDDAARRERERQVWLAAFTALLSAGYGVFNAETRADDAQAAYRQRWETPR